IVGRLHALVAAKMNSAYLQRLDLALHFGLLGATMGLDGNRRIVRTPKIASGHQSIDRLLRCGLIRSGYCNCSTVLVALCAGSGSARNRPFRSLAAAVATEVHIAQFHAFSRRCRPAKQD